MTKLRLRIVFGSVVLGPGKIELLEHIRDTGSISAAGRRMDMSYKRAWSLVETMNAAFSQPLVISSRGGAGGGGAQVTAAGETILGQYHAVEEAARIGGADNLAILRAMLKPVAETEAK